jgi:hypothetical protein
MGLYVRENMEIPTKILWGRDRFARISEIGGRIFRDIGSERVARGAHWPPQGAFDARRRGAKYVRHQFE